MNTKFTNFYFIFIAITLLQCTTPKRAMSKGDAESIKDLVIFPIYSKIEIIENGNRTITSESFSSEAEIEIKNKLKIYIPSTVNKNFFICQSDLAENIIKSNTQLIKISQKAFYLNKVIVPKFLLNLLDSLGENYGLFIFHRGFTRTPENLKTQYIKRRTAALA